VFVAARDHVNRNRFVSWMTTALVVVDWRGDWFDLAAGNQLAPTCAERTRSRRAARTAWSARSSPRRYRDCVYYQDRDYKTFRPCCYFDDW